MRKVYEDQDMTMVGYYQSLLEKEGIATSVKNEFASLASGEIPFTQVYPELWVSDDSDYERSVELIRNIRDASPEEESRPVSYKRSAMAQMTLWIGTLLVILLLVFTVSFFIQALLE